MVILIFIKRQVYGCIGATQAVKVTNYPQNNFVGALLSLFTAATVHNK